MIDEWANVGKINGEQASKEYHDDDRNARKHERGKPNVMSCKLKIEEGQRGVLSLH